MYLRGAGKLALRGRCWLLGGHRLLHSRVLLLLLGGDLRIASVAACILLLAVSRATLRLSESS